MLYVVTGGTGHLGYSLLKLLDKNKEKVRALVLPNDDISNIKDFNIEIMYGDVTNKDSLKQLFSNTSEEICLIHAAGVISISNKPNKLMTSVNIMGTINIIDEALNNNVSHIIYTSSVHAIKEEPNNGLIKETRDFNPDDVVGAYAKTKAMATKYVVERLKRGAPITVVHPAGIIGPYDFGKGHMTKLVEKYLNKDLTTRVTGGYNFVDVRDVSDAIYQLSKKKVYDTFILSGNYVSLKDFFNILKMLSGRKRRINVLSAKFVKIFAPLMEWVAYKRKEPPLFSAYSLYTLESNSNFTNEKIKSVIDYDPRPTDITVYDTAIWLIEQKRLHHKTIIDYIKAGIGKLPFVRKDKDEGN